ncbi:MAG: hypothetical protein COB90_10390 [Hyphomicrobiales bacterium]|nr:MAG: hypothetical protein COB90_10390 [Hyphomicrobiales bacterium]
MRRVAKLVEVGPDWIAKITNIHPCDINQYKTRTFNLVRLAVVERYDVNSKQTSNKMALFVILRTYWY